MKYELNNIYNEDSYKAIKDIPDDSIDCIYTDVAYLFKNARSKGDGCLGERFNKGQDELEFISEGFDIVILAHSHKPVCEILNGKYYINSGDWIENFSYILMTEESVELKYWKS